MAVFIIALAPGLAHSGFFMPGADDEIEGGYRIEGQLVFGHTGTEPNERDGEQVERMAAVAERSGDGEIKGRSLSFGFACN